MPLSIFPPFLSACVAAVKISLFCLYNACQFQIFESVPLFLAPTPLLDIPHFPPHPTVFSFRIFLSSSDRFLHPLPSPTASALDVPDHILLVAFFSAQFPLLALHCADCVSCFFPPICLRSFFILLQYALAEAFPVRLGTVFCLLISPLSQADLSNFPTYFAAGCPGSCPSSYHFKDASSILKGNSQSKARSLLLFHAFLAIPPY